MSDHFTRVLSRPEFIALMAALMALNALAIDAYCRALQLDAAQCKANAPTSPKARNCWNLALKKSGLA